MFRTTLHVNEETDVDATVSRLRAECERSGLSADHTALVIYDVQQTLQQLVQRGAEVARLGSQMTVSRELRGADYNIMIAFGAGVPDGFFERLKRKILGG
ncbi:MAG: hypothetical protein JWN71_4188 [Xanthobacteraceae bacterium]|nr:hypothetical protein [Xanthobacteraceae bacterium]